MKSDLSMLTARPAAAPAQSQNGLGYPLPVVIVVAVMLAFAIIWLVARPTTGLALALTVIFVIAGFVPLFWRTRLVARARSDNAHVLAALGAATADIPLRLRTRMPLLLVVGDDLAALFDRHNGQRFVHVGDGAIWVRVDQTQLLPRMAIAVRQWRDGRAPDGIVISVAPGRYMDEDVLTQSLRVARQSIADAAKILGIRSLPGYVAIYQRLAPDGIRAGAPERIPEFGTTTASDLLTPQWYGAASANGNVDALCFESVIRAAGNEAAQTTGSAVPVARAAALDSIIGWTQRVVMHALTESRQPAAPLAMYGIGWIDCGPACGPGRPWEDEVRSHTGVARAPSGASPLPWPLPQPLVQSIPQRFWMSPRVVALAHALTLVACAAAIAFYFSTRHNQELISRIGSDLGRWSMIPSSHDTAKRDALNNLVADRDELERYARSGTPLSLSFGLYRGARLIPPLNEAIASYHPPAPPPQIVTLDSMSLFDSGSSKLKDGSTKVMVNALEMIKAHPGKRILVAGYTDNVGDPDSNLKLSAARAEAVRDWLVEVSGIALTQFAIQGYGDTRPVADNTTDAGRAKNRRVEITLVPDVSIAPTPSAATQGSDSSPGNAI